MKIDDSTVFVPTASALIESAIGVSFTTRDRRRINVVVAELTDEAIAEGAFIGQRECVEALREAVHSEAADLLARLFMVEGER